MRVNCPKCGREFNVPESETQRLLRCMCKNLFRASDALKEKKDTSQPDEAPVKLEARQGFYLDDDSVSQEVESSLSGEELEGFLSTLKKGREELGQAEAASKPSVKVNLPTERTIELGDSKVERKPPKVPPAEDIIPELLSQQTTSASGDLRTVKPPPYAAPQKAPPKNQPVETYRPSLWERFQDLSLTKQLMLIFAAAIPLFILGISLQPKEAPPPPMDPSVAKLLAPPPAVQDVAPKPALPKREATTVQAVKATPISSPKVEEPKEPDQPSIFSQLYQNTLSGNFENVIRIASSQERALNNDARALYFEAQLVRAGKDSKRIQEVRSIIQASTQSRDVDPSLRRALLTSYLRDPAARQGLAKVVENFKALAITHSRDPLLFAYLGMAYEKLDRPDLAHETWDQALVLEPKLSWVIQRREQIYRAMKDYKAALSMASRLTKLKGFEADGFTRMAEISKMMGNPKASQDYLRQALKFKENPQVRLELANEAAKTSKDPLKDLAAALAASKDKKTRAKILTQMGHRQCASNAIDAGIKSLRQATKERPDYAAAYYERGLCERQAGNAKKSADAFAWALKYEQGDHRIWMQYALSLDLDGKTRAALSALNRSLQIEPTDQGHLQMAQMLLKLKKPQEALVHAKKAFKLNPKNEKARNMVAELEK